MNKSILTLLLLALVLQSNAQIKQVLRGKIIEKESSC